jgi:hypothetical protein
MTTRVNDFQLNKDKVKQASSNPHSIKINSLSWAQQQVPSTRPNCTLQRISHDEHPTKSYGNPISQPKRDTSLRIFFQNIKGLSHTPSGEDYNYYCQQFRDLQIDVAGLAETNTAWQHQILRQAFTSKARRVGKGMSKTSFGSPTTTIDCRIPPQETFQAGGSLTVCFGSWTTSIFGHDIQDPTGLGRWSGLTFRGKHDNALSIITAYRTCSGSHQTAALGSTFHREVEFFETATLPQRAKIPDNGSSMTCVKQYYNSAIPGMQCY